MGRKPTEIKCPPNIQDTCSQHAITEDFDSGPSYGSTHKYLCPQDKTIDHTHEFLFYFFLLWYIWSVCPLMQYHAILITVVSQPVLKLDHVSPPSLFFFQSFLVFLVYLLCHLFLDHLLIFQKSTTNFDRDQIKYIHQCGENWCLKNIVLQSLNSEWLSI